MAKMDETTVSRNNSATVPKAFRNAEDVSPGDKIEWHHEGDDWIVSKKPEDSE